MPNARVGSRVNLNPVNDRLDKVENRLDSLEQQQKSTFDRTGLILDELLGVKGEVLDMKQMLHLLLEKEGIPIPEREKV